ncbi:MAG: DUF4114 domain-containing protein [Deltaproteobacteria bacterium]|nr:DUF4114 domain-containing protein [Deltaproteobacteria bacterium]
MKRLLSLVMLILFLTAGAAFAVPFTFGPGTTGEASLQTILNNITVNGDSSVTTTTDSLADTSDSYWQFDATNNASSTIVIELAGQSGSNTFGIYDANTKNTLSLFGGSAGQGDSVLLSLLNNNTVLAISVNPNSGAITTLGTMQLTSSYFGFYLGTSGGTFYSDSGLNTDNNADHMLAYQGEGDLVRIPTRNPGPWTASEYILAWEDLAQVNNTYPGDGDYNDFVVMVESLSPVPEPSTMLLLGAGLLGLGVYRRMRK